MKLKPILLGIALLIPGLAHAQKRNWIPVDEKAEEGSPVAVHVLKSDPKETTLQVRIPGFWVEEGTIGKERFSKLTFPEPRISGEGYPRRQGERGWWDFPAEDKQELRPAEAFMRGMQIGQRQTPIPDELGYKGLTSIQQIIENKLSLEGARPGTARLRGFLSVHGKSKIGEDLVIETQPQYREFDLPAPLAPAGYVGSDQERDPRLGYTPAPLIDRQFYAKGSRVPYVGDEPQLTVLSRSSRFPTAEFSVALSAFVNERTVLVPETILIRIKHLRGPFDFECPIPWDHWMFCLPFINGDAIRDSLTAKGLKIESSRSARYLIITPQEYRATLNDFALWKNSKGLNVDFAYVGGTPTDDVAADRDEIDSYIEDYFERHYCHGVYVLLVGDVGVIPSGRSDNVIASPDEEDSDSDHVYEVYEDDKIPSVYVGRLSVDSKEELQAQLTKILSYERNPVGGDWPLKAALAANSENDDGTRFVSASFPSKYAQAVNEIVGYGGYTNPPAFQVYHAGSNSAATVRATNQDVIDAIDEGVGHVLYRGHGSGSTWLGGWDANGNSFDSTNDVGALNNSAFPIVYSISCQNGRLRNSDCIAEVWMSQENSGAVAHFGASANSYTSENHWRAKGIFRSIYDAGFTRLGPALAYAECISLLNHGGGAAWSSNTFCYNLLGCPELTIRKARVPQRFTPVTEIEFIGLYATLLRVRDEKGSPLAGVLATLFLKNGDTTTGTTNEKGELTFKIPDPGLVEKVTVNHGGLSKEILPSPESEWVWMPLERNYPEGTPVSVEVCSCNENETELDIRVPGFWKRTINYNGQPYTQIRLPDPVLFGEGFPRLETLDAASRVVGLRGLIGADGLLSDRAPFLKKGDDNWFDFPADQNGEAFSPASYMQNMTIGVQQAAFPESALGKNPRSVKDMIALGIDPRGARPGIPHLRGPIFAALGSKLGENFKLEPLGNKKMKFNLENPLLPAGFQGSDQAEENEGYNAPELVDQDFYAGNNAAYTGGEQPLGQVQRIGGAFGGTQLSLPLCEVGNAEELNMFCNFRCRIVHRVPFQRIYPCLPWDSWVSKPSFINGAALRTRLQLSKVPILTKRTARYLIVTEREFEDDLADFAAWKRQKGLLVKFVYVGDDADDDVSADRDEIDEYLENYYHQNWCHGVYVLLVGDIDRIPGGRSDKVIAGPDGADADSDHVYEVIGDDDHASLYVGRLSIDDADDLTVQLNKILRYEQNPALGFWPTRVTLAANSQNDNDNYGIDPQWPSKYAAAVNAIANYTNYTNPPTFSVRHAGAADNTTTRATNQDVIDDIEAGRNMVLYRGHGSGTEWVAGWDGTSDWGDAFGTSEINELDNSAVFPIVYSIACQNNRINRSDCAGENWMSRVGGGSVAYWSASVNSYTSENHERAKGIFKAIYERGVTRLGPALATAERISSNTYGDNIYWQNNTFCYLLLGDPEMTIRRSPVLHPFLVVPELIEIPQGIRINLRDELQNPLLSHRVNIVLTNGEILNGLTDDDGAVELPAEPGAVAKIVVLNEKSGQVQVTDSDTVSGSVIALSDNTIPEGNASGYEVGTFKTLVDGDVENSNYRFVTGEGSEDNGIFRISESRLLFQGTANHEGRPAYSVRVRSTYEGGNTTQVFVINVIDDRTEDADGDGLTELEEEEVHGTSDLDPDSDRDGLGDEVELGLAELGFDPAVDNSEQIAALEESTGFFTRNSILDANAGDLMIERNPDGNFLLQFQLQELDEETETFRSLGPVKEWIYKPQDHQHFFRIEIKK